MEFLLLAMGFLACWALVLYLGFSETAEWVIPIIFLAGMACAVAFGFLAWGAVT